MKAREHMKIAFLLFDEHTALDIVGPYEVLSRLPEAKMYFVGREKRAYKDRNGLSILADSTLEEISRVDVLVIPGGPGIDAILHNTHIHDWIKKLNHTCTWIVTVCSGSLLLAETGLLNQKKCTTHWKRKKQLSEYNVIVQDERYIHEGKFITSAGVSAGIDMAIYLVAQIAGEGVAKSIQRGIEYNPKPPFDYVTLL